MIFSGGGSASFWEEEKPIYNYKDLFGKKIWVFLKGKWYQSETFAPKRGVDPDSNWDDYFQGTYITVIVTIKKGIFSKEKVSVYITNEKYREHIEHNREKSINIIL